MMEPEILVFMKNGDVTLTLTRNITKETESRSRSSSISSDISELEHTAVEEDATGVEDESRDEEGPVESFLFFAPEAPGSEDGPMYPPSPRARRGSDASSRRDRSASPPASFWASLKRQAAKAEKAIEEKPKQKKRSKKKVEKTIVSSHEVQCVVSSRHLMLASRQFEAILGGNTTEASVLRSKGHVTLAMSADFDSMVILLNIIHGASRKVPRKLSLEDLSKIATLVCQLGMLESVQFFSDTWIDGFQRGLPKAYNEKVLRLLFVFWVFDREDEFKTMTRLAQRECNENFEDDIQDIPIPHNIIDAIKKDREFAIETAITIVHALITRYLDGQTICDYGLDDELRYACDSMVLGSLVKSSRRIGIWPQPEAPFAGTKFNDLSQAIRGIKILDVCNKSSRSLKSIGSSGNAHGLEDSIAASMKDVEAGLDGLELSQYSRKSDDLASGSQIFQLIPPKEEVKPPMTPDTPRNSQLYAYEKPIHFQQEDFKSHPQYQVLESAFSPQPNTRASRDEPTFQTDFQNPETVSLSRTSSRTAVEVLKNEEPQRSPSTRSSPRPVYQDLDSRVVEDVQVPQKQFQRDIQDDVARISRQTSVHEVQRPVQQIERVESNYTPVQEIQRPGREVERSTSNYSTNQEFQRPVREPERSISNHSFSQEIRLSERPINRNIEEPRRGYQPSPSREKRFSSPEARERIQSEERKQSPNGSFSQGVKPVSRPVSQLVQSSNATRQETKSAPRDELRAALTQYKNSTGQYQQAQGRTNGYNKLEEKASPKEERPSPTYAYSQPVQEVQVSPSHVPEVVATETRQGPKTSNTKEETSTNFNANRTSHQSQILSNSRPFSTSYIHATSTNAPQPTSQSTQSSSIDRPVPTSTASSNSIISQTQREEPKQHTNPNINTKRPSPPPSTIAEATRDALKTTVTSNNTYQSTNSSSSQNQNPNSSASTSSSTSTTQNSNSKAPTNGGTNTNGTNGNENEEDEVSSGILSQFKMRKAKKNKFATRF